MPARSSDVLSKLVDPLVIIVVDVIVRLANRLKALSMTTYSSDEDSDGTTERTSPKKSPSTNGGSAFAEVVRATLKAKELERETVTSKTV